MHTVRDWMVDLVVFIDPDKPVIEALALMRRRFIHSLIVNKGPDNREYGILTSTDICDKIIAQERDPVTTRVKEVMTSPLITVPETASLKECAQLMREHHIHHLPVVDKNSKLVGMISATDFLVAAEALSRAPGEKLV